MKPIFLSKRLWVSLVIFTGILLLKQAPLPLSLGIALLAYLFNPATLRPLRSTRFWIVISLLVLLVPLFTGDLESRFLGISYSADQLASMLMMSLRGITVFLLLQVLTQDLRSRRTHEVLLKLHLDHFENLFTISTEILPLLRSVLKARSSQVFKEKKFPPPGRLIPFAVLVIQDLVVLADSLSSEPETSKTMTPGELLERMSDNGRGTLVIVFGNPGSGKSPWVDKLVGELRLKRIKVSGVLSHKTILSEETWHHEIELLPSGERRALNTMDNLDGALRVGKFSFYPGVFSWAADQIEQNLDSDWFIIDEVGPLELKGDGFAPILSTLDSLHERVVVLTMRSNYETKLDTFFKQYPSLASRESVIVRLPSTTHTAIQPLVVAEP